MNPSFLRLFRNLGAMVLAGRPTRRAIAAAVKLCGRRLERRWPFFPRAEGKELNLGFGDLLAFQYARSRNFSALVVGAFDGVENDPTSEFIRTSQCKAIFVEPQPGPFQRLSESMRGRSGVQTLNAAIDETSGSREMYCIPPGNEGLPAWTEQLASFRREHILNHEDRVPGLSRHIMTLNVQTLSFEDLLEKYQLQSLDLLQIDAEGMDVQLLAWFPFDCIKPALLHYETAHMSADEHQSVTQRLQCLGYTVRVSDSPTDDMAIIF
jgi:FkbM family methyltransferase